MPLAPARARRQRRRAGRHLPGWPCCCRASAQRAVGRPARWSQVDAGRPAVPHRPAGHLLVRRGRRPAEDEQRQRARRSRSPSPACRRAAGSARARCSSASPTATTSRRCARAWWPACRSTPSTGCSTTPSASTASCMNQLNERLGQFIAAREIDRMNNPDVRVARSLAALFNPVLYPGVGERAAHHAAGAGLPGRAVAPARQRGAARAAGGRADPRRVRRRARARPGAAARASAAP